MSASATIWIKTLRLPTILLAASSVILGTGLAMYHGSINTKVFVATLVTAACLQLLTNLANDYGDTRSGVDNAVDTGSPIQAKEISLSEVKTGVYCFTALSLLSGIYLLFISLPQSATYWLAFAAIGLCAVIAAITYTLGPSPYGYRGWGDISVAIFFGLVGVGGSYFLQRLELADGWYLPAISFGLLVVTVLNINNIRDVQTDTQFSKNTLVVYIGNRRAVGYHWLLIFAAFASYLVYVEQHCQGYYPLLALATLPFFVRIALALPKQQSRQGFDQLLQQTVLFSFIFCLLFTLGLWLDK